MDSLNHSRSIRSTMFCAVLLASGLAIEVPVAVASSAAPATTAARGESLSDSAVDAARAFIKSSRIDKSKEDWKQRLKMPPKLTFRKDRRYNWHLETSAGNIVIELMPEVAPMHVSSTIYLTRLGFYDGTVFHRVIKGFMAQGGDPLGTGLGGPGYKYDSEFSEEVRHDRAGLLSMANAGPGTDGSQFFLTFAPTPHLDGRHTIFGKVIKGMETLRALESHGSRTGKPSELLKLGRATIVVCADA